MVGSAFPVNLRYVCARIAYRAALRSLDCVVAPIICARLLPKTSNKRSSILIVFYPILISTGLLKRLSNWSSIVVVESGMIWVRMWFDFGHSLYTIHELSQHERPATTGKRLYSYGGE